MRKARWAAKARAAHGTSAVNLGEKLSAEQESADHEEQADTRVAAAEVGFCERYGRPRWNDEAWGEPLLSPHIYTMIAEATGRGIATRMNTNFSLPFDAAKAERLIAAGLTALTVSIDGATQASYERYRVRGNLETVLHNCRLIRDAKRRLRSRTPITNWEFHVFPHNMADIDAVRAMAAELEMGLLTFKGAVPGADWDVDGDWHFCVRPQATPCVGLWSIGVVNSDGGVAPCRGTFYREDDMGALSARHGAPGATSFRAVWNGPLYQSARRFFRRREGTPAERQHVCFECPATLGWAKWQAHAANGGTAATFDIGYTTGDAWNYFWKRQPPRRGAHDLRGLPTAPPTLQPAPFNLPAGGRVEVDTRETRHAGNHG